MQPANPVSPKIQPPQLSREVCGDCGHCGVAVLASPGWSATSLSTVKRPATWARPKRVWRPCSKITFSQPPAAVASPVTFPSVHFQIRSSRRAARRRQVVANLTVNLSFCGARHNVAERNWTTTCRPQIIIRACILLRSRTAGQVAKVPCHAMPCYPNGPSAENQTTGHPAWGNWGGIGCGYEDLDSSSSFGCFSFLPFVFPFPP